MMSLLSILFESLSCAELILKVRQITIDMFFYIFFYTMASSITSMTALAVDWKYATTNCLDWKYATANSYVKRTAVLLRWHGSKYIVVTYF